MLYAGPLALGTFIWAQQNFGSCAISTAVGFKPVIWACASTAKRISGTRAVAGNVRAMTGILIASRRRESGDAKHPDKSRSVAFLMRLHRVDKVSQPWGCRASTDGIAVPNCMSPDCFASALLKLVAEQTNVVPVPIRDDQPALFVVVLGVVVASLPHSRLQSRQVDPR